MTEKRLNIQCWAANFQHLRRLPMGTISLFSNMRMLRTKSPLLRLKERANHCLSHSHRSCPYSKADRDSSVNAMTFFGPSNNLWAFSLPFLYSTYATGGSKPPFCSAQVSRIHNLSNFQENSFHVFCIAKH